MKNTLIALFIVVVLAGGVWYFAGHRSSSPMSSASPTPMVSMDMSSMPSASPTVTPKPKASTSPTPGVIIKETKIHNVAVANFAYSPASLTVTKGDVVIFTNSDATLHTVTSDTPGVFDSGNLDPNAQWQLATANMKPGTYTYHCNFHSSMHGTLIIQ